MNSFLSVLIPIVLMASTASADPSFSKLTSQFENAQRITTAVGAEGALQVGGSLSCTLHYSDGSQRAMPQEKYTKMGSDTFVLQKSPEMESVIFHVTSKGLMGSQFIDNWVDIVEVRLVGKKILKGYFNTNDVQQVFAIVSCEKSVD